MYRNPMDVTGILLDAYIFTGYDRSYHYKKSKMIILFIAGWADNYRWYWTKESTGSSWTYIKCFIQMNEQLLRQ